MNLNKLEVLWFKILKEKTGSLFIFIFLLIIPFNFFKLLSIFFISNIIFPSDVKQNKDKFLYYLPFSKKEVVVYVYLLLTAIVLITYFLVMPIVSTSYFSFFSRLWYLINFQTLIFSIALIAVSFKLDNIGISIVYIILDSLFSSLGSTKLGNTFNPYIFISVLRQGNKFLTSVFAFLILLLAIRLYSRSDKYAKNWKT